MATITSTGAAVAALAALAMSMGGAGARDRARPVAAPSVGVGQHATVMNNIYQAQQQNNAVIDQVRNNIRANQPRTY